MCFKQNKTFFKAINWCFMTLHLIFLITCVLVIVIRDTPLTLYYKLLVTHNQFIDVYPIYVPLVVHSSGVLFHFIFALSGSTIVDGYIAYSYSNPLRWFLQLMVDGGSLVGLMLIHGFHTIESIIHIIIIYIAILGFCYYQDHYLNPTLNFNPEKEPHFFAIPLHIVMIILIIATASEHINDDKSLRIAIITLISLGLTLLSYIIQRMHIRYRSSLVDPVDSADDSDTNELENVVPTDEKMAKLDEAISEIRRGIQYESYYYLNSILFAMTVTWFIITITQSNEILH